MVPFKPSLQFYRRRASRLSLLLGIVAFSTFAVTPSASAAPSQARVHRVTFLDNDGPIPLDSGTHCNQNVCMSVYSYDGDGNDITNVKVWTANNVDVPVGTWFYLYVGPNTSDMTLFDDAEMDLPGYNGVNFPVYNYAPVGLMCAAISGQPGFPCVTIGPEDD